MFTGHFVQSAYLNGLKTHLNADFFVQVEFFLQLNKIYEWKYGEQMCGHCH